MIEQLFVRDYVLFDREQVDFNGQMTVITGETGAGKSLLIDAIGYLCGNRLNGNVVRKGAQKAVLQMILSQPSQEALDLLRENDFEMEDDEVLITRTIFPTGKSRIQVNGQNATNAFVKKLTSKFLDIHSQMDTIKLVEPQVQLELLDQYARNEDLLEQTETAWNDLSRINREIRKLKNETFSDEELERLTRSLNEIEQSRLQPGELDELEQSIAQSENFQKNMEDFRQILQYFNRDNGIIDSLAAAQKILDRNGSFDRQAERLGDLYEQIRDISYEIEAQKEQLEDQVGNLDEMIERQMEIKTLYRKYGGSFEAIQKTRGEIEEKINRILHRQDVFEKLAKEKKEKQKAYLEKARALSQSRQAVISRLEEQIITHARDLMLENIRFEIRRKDKTASAKGIDEIEFVASMNPGTPLSPLKQAGSGGELSRLMLALKTVFQAENGITTLIFDEIDTGVSGKVALAMGSKMKTLAENYQVFSITHLPSVAVWADDHLRVVKESEEERTITKVEVLDEPTHFEELAIMASGSAQPEAVESMRQLSQRIHHG